MEALLEQDPESDPDPAQDESITGSFHSIEIAYHSFPTPSSPSPLPPSPTAVSDSDYSQLSEDPPDSIQTRESRLHALLQREYEVDNLLCTIITLFVTGVIAAILICVPNR